MSTDVKFSFSIIDITEKRVSIKITPITIRPPDFNLFWHSSIIFCVSPPVPPIKIALASGSSEIFSFAFPKMTLTLDTPNFSRFFLVNSTAFESKSIAKTFPFDST